MAAAAAGADDGGTGSDRSISRRLAATNHLHGPAQAMTWLA